MSVDDIRAELLTQARRRFGPERTEALTAELEALAADLERIAGAQLPADGEPGFFLVED